MKVLLACEYPSLNGGENSLLAILPLIQAKGVQAIAAVPQTGELAKAFENLGVPTYDFDLSRYKGHDKHVAKGQRLAEIVVESKADLVHANSLSCGRASGLVGEQLGIPSLAHLRDIIRLSKSAISDIARNSTLIAVSQATKDWYVNLGVPAEQIEVVHNGVDGQIFQPDLECESVRHEFGLEANSQIVLSVGQIGIRKGVDTLIEAAKVVVSRLPRVRFFIVGERHSTKAEAIEYEKRLHNAAQSELLRGKVRFLGRRADIPRLMAATTVFVHSARQEPLGRVLLEAAATGCCVLATDVGGTNEIFPPGSRTAQVVPPDDPLNLAKNLVSLLENSEERKQLGDNARERMLQEFTLEKSATAILEKYSQSLQRR